MKLNPDCIRDVMLEVEKSWEIYEEDSGALAMGCIEIGEIFQALPDYDKKDIFYSIYNLDQAGYLDVETIFADGGIVYHCVINSMTYQGHEFLDQIRDPKHWNAIKGGLSAVRNYSLDAINAIASGVTAAAISAYLKSNAP